MIDTDDINMKRPIVIFGVHRSGTSVVASVIEKMNVWCGHRDELLAAQSDNKRGFWERQDVVNLNDDILQSAKLKWHTYSTGMNEQLISELSNKYAQQITTIVNKLNQHPVWLLKDPRFCSTWPVWEPFIKNPPVFVSVYRDPYSVAKSLNARNNMPMPLALGLWESHVVAMSRIVCQNPNHISLLHENIMADPDDEFTRLNTELKNRIDNITTLAPQAIADLFDFKLVHQNAGIDTGNDLPVHTKRIWELIKNQQFKDISEFELPDHYADNDLITVWNSLYENSLELQQLKSEHSESLENIEKLLLNRDLLENEKAEAIQVFEKTAVELNKFKSWGVELKTLNQKLEQEIQSLKQEIQSLNQYIQALLNSTSWKLTRPLRSVARNAKPVARKAAFCAISVVTRGIRTLYHLVPVKQGAKVRLKNLAFERFPTIFSRFPTYRIWELSRGKIDHQSSVNRNPIVDEYPDVPGERESAKLNDCLNDKCSAQPIVSIIIPVHGQLKYTYMCLDSICRIETQVPFEIIIVDDKSPDSTNDFLSKVKALNLITNENNQGFIKNCNLGAQAAKGDYLVFLNNDTQITDGWLDQLHATFKSVPDAGLVGSKLVYPDGRLQEAGGIIWSDGSAWNYGNGADPDDPEFNYLHEVDYCSGASLMIEKKFFNELGQFDERYLPAYGEDSDLAFKVRGAGKKVYYQPLSVVVHYEGISSGTDISSGVKKYQVDNAKKLYLRWINEIKLLENPGENIPDAKDKGRVGRILVLDHCTPTPDMDAGSITALNLMRLLTAHGYQVTFIAEDNLLFLPGYTEDMQKIGIEVLYAPYINSVESHLQQQGERYDAVLLFRPLVVERHLSSVIKLCPRAKLIYHVSDLHFLRLQRENEVKKMELKNTSEKNQDIDALRKKEIDLIRKMDAAIVHSDFEHDMLVNEFNCTNIHILIWSIDIPGSISNFGDRSDICFIGGYQHPPNVDAVDFFVEKVFPLITKSHPHIRFHIIGSNPPSHFQSYASDNIVVTGYVKDLYPILSKIRVAVAPLRYGAGIKGKIGTTLSVGLPCVATGIAAEGMNLNDQVDILLADEPQAMADAVLQLYDNPSLWKQISENGINLAEKSYGMTQAMGIVRNLLAKINLKKMTCEELESVTIRQYSIFKKISESENLAKTTQHQIEAPTLTSSIITDDEYQKKLKKEKENFAQTVNVHDLPDIFHYWSNRYLKPKFDGLKIRGIYEFFADAIINGKSRSESPNTRCKVVSLASGNCDVEVAIAKELFKLGFDNFTIECIELVPEMLERGRENAASQGMTDYFKFTCIDILGWEPDASSLDTVMVNQALHHFLELEVLFDKIKHGIGNRGIFVTSDMIGRNGHMRWPEALRFIDEIWEGMPDRYKNNHLLQRKEKKFENWDCSTESFEGIRAQDILPLLIEQFNFELFLGYGNLIDIFVDRAFGHNFDINSQEDKDFIDKIATLDQELIDKGTIKPTHMIAIMSLSDKKCVCDRHITPEFSVREVN